jgi:NADPH-dependent 2,4-dienoyl-CoA reductase/sulfur reductase-like enzyme
MVGAMLRDVVVVGASLAGLRAAEALRTDGYDGRLILVGAEDHLPYDRPPLSKKVLAGEWEPERIHLRKSDEYEQLEFDLRLGVQAMALDMASRQVELSDGSRVAFDGVVIATGAAPRRLPGQPELEGIFELRTLDDSLALRAALDASPRRVVVIGAGFIGAEVAATARGRGLDVSLVEALPVPLARGLGPTLGSAIAALHRAYGTDVRLGVGVDAIEGAARVERVRLTDGTVLEADVVVVGVGVAPATDWLDGSGLELRDGVVCDATLAAGPPGVYAAGDLTRWPNELFGEEMRVEHWTNAAEQGAAAARNLLATAAGGAGTAYAPVPFFWSDQFDARIQFLGRAGPDDDVALVHGDLTSPQLVALYGRAGRFRGVFGLSSPKLVMRYRKLLLAGTSWDDALAFAREQEG